MEVLSILVLRLNLSLVLCILKQSFIVIFIIFSSSITVTLLGSAIPAFGDLHDDFWNGFYTLSDGEVSPDGNWQNVYNGGGASGVGISGDKHVFFLYPRVSNSTSETSANLVTSTKEFSNFIFDVDVRTAQQLRKNNPPNDWETAWILFRYTDTFHYYWFELNPGGVELGKKDCDKCTDPVQGQIFLSTVDKPKLKIGDWSHWKIAAVGNHFRLTINGTRAIDFVDNKMSDRLAKGSVGLYTEDAYAEFNDVNITSVNFHNFT